MCINLIFFWLNKQLLHDSLADKVSILQGLWLCHCMGLYPEWWQLNWYKYALMFLFASIQAYVSDFTKYNS